MSENPVSSLTLAGHLDLIRVSSKSLVPSRKKKHRYWFLFDEQACQLRYYANEVDLKTPQGTINMTSCGISLSLERGEVSERTVIISQGSTEYHLLASSSQDARKWYTGLQDKKESAKRAKRKSLVTTPAAPITTSKTNKTSRSFDSLNPSSLSFPVPSVFSAPSQSKLSPEVSGNRKWLETETSKLVRSHSLDDTRDETEADSLLPQRPATITSMTGREDVDCSEPTPPVLPPKSPSLVQDSPDVTPDTSAQGPPSLPPKDDSYVFVELTSFSPEVQSRVSSLDLQVNSLKRDVELREKQLEEQQRLNEELRRIVDRLVDTDPDNKRNVKRLVTEVKDLQLRVEHLESVNKTLNHQLLKAQKKEEEEERHHDVIERQFLSIKAQHVKWLIRVFSIPTGSTTYLPGPEVVSPEEERARVEVRRMLKDDCPVEEFCQIFNSDRLLDFQDECGDTYYAENEPLAYAYLLRRLYLRYTHETQEEARKKWIDFFKTVKISPKGFHDLSDRKKELKSLLLMGFPLSCRDMRVQLWNSLITRWIGDMRTRLDEQHNGSYYLCLLERSEKEECIHEKQITLDLERTLPSNILFKPETEAIYKMYNVLMAFAHHAPQTGYTQGMNQLVALSLFFLDEEMAFWCLVAIVEKILPGDYYSHGLVGAQADQTLLLDVVTEKLPDLVSHLKRVDNINVTWVTLNWFITLFVDALPTEPAIRLWDFVLLEGRIALFRFTVGLLNMYKTQILQIRDSVTLLQFLKNMTRHTFDVEEMCREANDAKVSSNILKRFEHHFLKIKKEFLKAEREKAEEMQAEAERLYQKKLKAITAAEKLAPSPKSEEPVTTPKSALRRHFTVAHYLSQSSSDRRVFTKPRWLCSCPCRKNEVWLVFQSGNKSSTVVSVSISPAIKMDCIDIDIPKDPTCMYYNSQCNTVLVGTLSFKVLAYDLLTHERLWSQSLQDSILCVTSWNTSTFVGVADGSVVVFENLDRTGRQTPKMLKLGSNAVPIMLVTSTEQLWCAVGTSIILINLQTLEQIDSITADDTQQRSIFNNLSQSTHGVWASYRSSTMITLFDVHTLATLLNIDYKQVVMGQEVPDTSEQTQHDLRVTGFLVNDNILWIGTGGGSVMFFNIEGTMKGPSEGEVKGFQRGRSSIRLKRKKTLSSRPGLLVTEENESQNLIEMSVKSDTGVLLTNSPHLSSKMRLTSTLRMARIPEARSAYKLNFINGQSVAKTTDHVRKFIGFNCEQNTYILSCVRATNEDSNSIQIWDCRESDPSKWSFRNLDYVGFHQNSGLDQPH